MATYSERNSAPVPTSIIIAKDGQSLNPNWADIVIPSTSTSDETYINQAINDLPAAGGKITLLEGIYTIDGSILPLSNVTIEGNDYSTEIRVMDNINAHVYMLDMNAKTNVTIKNLKLNGNKTNRVGGNQECIRLINCSYCNIEKVYCTDVFTCAIEASGTTYSEYKNCIFVNTASTSRADIYLTAACNWNIVTGNIIYNSSQPGIYLHTNTCYNLVLNNIINTVTVGVDMLTNSNYNVIVGNFIDNATSYSLYSTNCSRNIISNNNIIRGVYGIYWIGGEYNVINENRIALSNQHGMFIQSAPNNQISSNFVSEVSQQTNNTYDCIIIDSNSDSNNVQANTCRRGSLANQARFGINVANANCDTNLVTNNDLLNSGVTGSLNDAGTGTVTAAGNRL